MSAPDRSVMGLLTTAADYFAKKGLSTPRLDAELLLAFTLDMSRVNLYCCFDRPLNKEETDRYRELVRRRVAKEPVAYILGWKEFYGLEFSVTPAVLIPRPDTETIVEAALKWLEKRPDSRICDIGTGSGAIAVTLANSFPESTVLALDNSEEALKIAWKNIQAHGLDDRITVISGDLLGSLDDAFDLIVSNPPYVAEADRETLDAGILNYEPGAALFAGADGLDVIRRLVPEAAERLVPGGALMIEVGDGQADSVVNLFETSGVFSSVETKSDLAGVQRVVCGFDARGGSDG
jgi:release factor glutamine methyltransferase